MEQGFRSGWRAVLFCTAGVWHTRDRSRKGRADPPGLNSLFVPQDLSCYGPWFLSLLAEAYGIIGQPEAGLTVLAEALTLVETTGECWW